MNSASLANQSTLNTQLRLTQSKNENQPKRPTNLKRDLLSAPFSKSGWVISFNELEMTHPTQKNLSGTLDRNKNLLHLLKEGGQERKTPHPQVHSGMPATAAKLAARVLRGWQKTPAAHPSPAASRGRHQKEVRSGEQRLAPIWDVGSRCPKRSLKMLHPMPASLKRDFKKQQ